MKKRERIKAIVFDVGGVLALPKFPLNLIQNTHLAGVPSKYHHRNLGVHEYMADKLKIVMDQWFDSIDTIYAKSIEGKVSRDELIEKISINLGVSKTKVVRLVKKAYKLNFTQNKQLFKQASKFKKQGYKIGILSDQWHLSQEALMPKHLYRDFDTIIISCDPKVKMRKPNPKIYKLLLRKIKCPPHNVVFIDNQKWNLTPAKKLGMKIILFKDNEETLKELKKMGVE